MKNTVKRMLSLLLVFVMFATVMPLSVFADDGVVNNVSNTQQSTSYSTSVYARRLEAALTGNTRQDFVNIAKSQIGYHEGDNSSDLSGNNSSGENDYTEYGRLTKTNGEDWCGAFVTWCAMQAGIYNKAVGSILGVPYDAYVHSKTYSNSGYGTYHSTAESFVGNSGVVYPEADSPLYTPKTGDVFVVKQGHTGVVTSDFDTTSKSVNVVEGNAGNKVRENIIILKEDGKYYLGSRLICGFLTPDFETEHTTWSNNVFAPLWPVKQSYYINALDVYSGGSEHGGIDIQHNNHPQQDVYAIADGVVVAINNSCSHYSNYGDKCGSGWGNYIQIKHTINGNTYYSRYAHLTQNSLSVNVNDIVKAGQQIGKMGSSGNSTGPHLHLEIAEQQYASKPIRGRTFDYYMDNVQFLASVNMGFNSGLAEKSPAYGVWIKQNCTKRSDGYYYSAGNYNPTAEPTITITDPKMPTATHKKGENYGLRGIISTDYGLITNVWGYIYNESTKQYDQQTTEEPNRPTYDIRTGNVNNELKFSKLPTGTYIYGVDATANNNGKTATKNLIYSRFTVADNTIADKMPQLSISEPVYPTTLALNENFGLRGIIKTDRGVLTEVTGEICYENGVTVDRRTCYPNEATLDIQNSVINNSLSFAALNAGKYKYIVTATADNNGVESTVQLLCESFTVGDPTATPPTEPANFVATYVNDSTIALSWTESPGADSYNVQYYNRTNDMWKRDHDYTGGTSYQSTGVGIYNEWDYRVRAVKGGAASDWVYYHYYAHVEHTWNLDEGLVVKEPTCTAVGTMLYECTLCSATKTEIIPATGHSFSPEWSSDSLYHWHAATCEHSNEITDKAEHSWDAGAITAEATYLGDGIKTYACTVCGREKEEIIPYTGPIITGGTCGDKLTWTLDNQGVLTISGTGAMANSSISGPWSSYKDQIETVVISSGVTSIGRNSFQGLSGLTNVSIPTSVTTIGEYAFSGCSKLAEITIPTSVSVIERCVVPANTSVAVDQNSDYFKSADGVLYAKDGKTIYHVPNEYTSFTIPDQVETIFNGAFWYCSKLETVTLPSGLETMGNMAFYACYNLVSVTMSSNVTSIGMSAFWDCNKLTDVYYDGTEEQWDAFKAKANAAKNNTPLLNATVHYISTPQVLSEFAVASPANVTLSAPSGGWVIGENTFSVGADKPCVLAVSYDGGETYTRLTAKANGDGTYSFDVNITDENTIIACAYKGDANGDGDLSSGDVSRLNAGILHKADMSPLDALACDVNGDGELSSGDISRLNAAILKKVQLSW